VTHGIFIVLGNLIKNLVVLAIQKTIIFACKKKTTEENPRLLNLIESGVSYYSSDKEMVNKEKESEVILPIHHISGVCAALRFSNKREEDGPLHPFHEKVLNHAKLACILLPEHITVEKKQNKDTEGTQQQPSLYREQLSIVTFRRKWKKFAELKDEMMTVLRK